VKKWIKLIIFSLGALIKWETFIIRREQANSLVREGAKMVFLSRKWQEARGSASMVPKN
jgi:hypothetical protein